MPQGHRPAARLLESTSRHLPGLVQLLDVLRGLNIANPDVGAVLAWKDCNIAIG